MGEVAYEFSMVQDKDLQESAAFKVQEMVRELRAAIGKGGFDDNGVQNLVGKWTEAGQLAKGNGYWSSTRLVWTLTRGSGNFARKTSQELLNRLVRLEDALGKHHDIKVRFHAFNDAQDAMLVFVYEYRTRLRAKNPSALKTFDMKLRASLDGLNPDLWRKLEH